MKRLLLIAALFVATPAFAATDETNGDKARLTFGMPTFVTHPDDRSGGRDWNQGWFQNKGVLVDATWPVRKLGDNTRLRLGATLGGFDNSIFRTSIFAGGTVEVETYATKDLAFTIGTYAGGITGYDSSVIPAIAPYVGTSYALTDKVELGLREFWLPGRTLAGPSIAESDAYVTAVTVGTRF